MSRNHEDFAMRLAITTKQLAVPIFGLLSAVAASTAIQTPALAQAAASNTPTTSSAAKPVEGRIIYGRDVSYGSAIGPRTPGRAQTVVTGPTNLILDSLAAGLVPTSDDENAGITANTNSHAQLISSNIMLGMGALSSMSGSGSNGSEIGNIQSSATGGAIGQATGALRNALGSLRGVLGGGK